MLKKKIGLFKIPENIIEDTLKYKDSLNKYINGKYSEVEFRAKRVPMGIYEQRTAGRYMVRVRIPAGVVLIPQVIKIAELSKRFGDGVVHITTRQDMQIHFVKVENTPGILDELLDVGLSPRGGGGNTIRNITTCPFSGLCPYEEFDVTPFAVGLTEKFLSDESSFNLPRKFKIGFSGCIKDCGFVSVADCGFFAHEKSGRKGFSVYAGGGLGPHARTGIKIEDFIDEDEVYLVAEAVKRVFDRYGDRKNKHRARLRYVLERIGEQEFIDEYKSEYEMLRGEKERFVFQNYYDRYSLPFVDNRGFEKDEKEFEDFKSKDSLEDLKDSKNGWVTLKPEDFPESVRKYISLIYKEKYPDRYSIKVLLENGNISSEKLISLTKIAEKYGYGFLRTTQYQNIFLCGIKYDDLPEVFNYIENLEIPICNYSGVDVVSCAGASTCKLGLCLSRNLAAELNKLLVNGGEITEKNFSIRISGCPNGCGHHHIGDIGFQGGAKRIKSNLMPFYDVFVGANTEEGRASIGKNIGSLPARSIPEFIKRLMETESFLDISVARKVLDKFLTELEERFPENSYPEEYYIDFGSDERFSLAGRGPGECGAGVLDVVKLDIENSKEYLSEAKKLTEEDRKNSAIYNAVLSSARSLLVLFGEEPEKDYEVFSLFKKFLIDRGWIQQNAEEIVSKAIGYKMGELTSLEDIIDGCERVIKRVEELFYSLDSNLQFNVAPFKKDDKKMTMEVPSLKVDLRGVKCPMNFVKTKLALDKIEAGQICEIILDEGEPIENVPLSVAELGHEILEKKKVDNYYIIKVLKK